MNTIGIFLYAVSVVAWWAGFNYAAARASTARRRKLFSTAAALALAWPFAFIALAAALATKAAAKRGENDHRRFRGAYTIFLDENKPQEDQDFLNWTWKYATIIAREMIAKREGRTIKQLTRVTADPAQSN